MTPGLMTARPPISHLEDSMPTLPWRQGEKPKTNYGLPHQQLDQNPPVDIYGRL